MSNGQWHWERYGWGTERQWEVGIKKTSNCCPHPSNSLNYIFRSFPHSVQNWAQGLLTLCQEWTCHNEFVWERLGPTLQYVTGSRIEMSHVPVVKRSRVIIILTWIEEGQTGEKNIFSEYLNLPQIFMSEVIIKRLSENNVKLSGKIKAGFNLRW